MVDSDLLDPYEKLIEIEILGSTVSVPENNRVLRCFQFLSLRSISYGDFCWNGDCTNCQIWYHTEGQTEADDRPALACRIQVSEGMVITRVNNCVELEGIGDKPLEHEVLKHHGPLARELHAREGTVTPEPKLG